MYHSTTLHSTAHTHICVRCSCWLLPVQCTRGKKQIKGKEHTKKYDGFYSLLCRVVEWNDEVLLMPISVVCAAAVSSKYNASVTSIIECAVVSGTKRKNGNGDNYVMNVSRLGQCKLDIWNGNVLSRLVPFSFLFFLASFVPQFVVHVACALQIIT